MDEGVAIVQYYGVASGKKELKGLISEITVKKLGHIKFIIEIDSAEWLVIWDWE